MAVAPDAWSTWPCVTRTRPSVAATPDPVGSRRAAPRLSRCRGSPTPASIRRASRPDTTRYVWFPAPVQALGLWANREEDAHASEQARFTREVNRGFRLTHCGNVVRRYDRQAGRCYEACRVRRTRGHRTPDLMGITFDGPESRGRLCEILHKLSSAYRDVSYRGTRAPHEDRRRRSSDPSGPAESDRHPAGIVDDHWHLACPERVLEHPRQGRAVLLHVVILEGLLPPLVFVTGGARVGSRVLAVDVDHGPNLLA